ncbi:unnamed protein product [Aphanomyces euteiches]|uniref:Transmembrane protein n=1 Tax=Aphanomyces euteiches TaxID=100861 RepID=A0A6G0WC14_9STRA|nr:hypothetical protein Ae201684_016578 [Aphanomyces euteiches]KAH9084243.1 hypothetical protein Ae201684P_020492 [Aphanomyces euteiches]KAH9144505.1 hypothetical protein AeRB84_011558 [Aphanomyces euteiches]
MDVVTKVTDSIWSFFANEDTSHLVTASIISVSILMTLALLSQGSTDSVFQYGFGIWGQRAAKERIEAEERERDEAEREIFQDPVQHSKAPEEIGADLILASKIPWITLTLAVVAVAGSVHVVVSSSVPQ